MKKKMLKGLLVVIIGVAAFTAGNIVAKHVWPEPALETIDNRYGAIVRLVSEGRTFCTGTVVEKDLIITAAHCVLEQTPFGMMLRSGTIEIRPSENINLYTMAKVVYASPQMDQAMLRGAFFQYKTAPYITDPAVLVKYRKLNTPFVSCGYPLNGKLFCNNTHFNTPSNFYWNLKGLLIPGMSGGPTMLLDGTVIGVNVAVEGTDAVISPIYNITRSLPGVK